VYVAFPTVPLNGKAQFTPTEALPSDEAQRTTPRNRNRFPKADRYALTLSGTGRISPMLMKKASPVKTVAAVIICPIDTKKAAAQLPVYIPVTGADVAVVVEVSPPEEATVEEDEVIVPFVVVR
jgi:hypothetical protein